MLGSENHISPLPVSYLISIVEHSRASIHTVRNEDLHEMTFSSSFFSVLF